MMLRKTKYLNPILVFLFLLFCQETLSIGENCNDAFINEIEIIYCQIKKSRIKHSLPNLNEFRKNPPRTQLLLLKSPAKRLGLILPDLKNNTKHNNAQSQNSNASLTPNELPTSPPIVFHTEASTTGNNKIETLINSPTTITKNAKARHFRSAYKKRENQNISLKNCTLNNDLIVCHNKEFQLVTNRQNHEINEEIFFDTNRLRLPSRSLERFATRDNIQYLSEIYPTYIQKMIVLGLGDTTMSFTKFHSLYTMLTTQNRDFSARFEEMYELLKIEKKRNAIKKRYQDNYPPTLENCMFITKDLLTCDNIVQNWVYQEIL